MKESKTKLYQAFQTESDLSIQFPLENEKVGFLALDPDSGKKLEYWISYRTALLEIIHAPKMGLSLHSFNEKDFKSSPDQLLYLLKTVTRDELLIFIYSIFAICQNKNTLRYFEGVRARISSSLERDGKYTNSKKYEISVSIFLKRGFENPETDNGFAIVFKENHVTRNFEFLTIREITPKQITDFLRNRVLDVENFY